MDAEEALIEKRRAEAEARAAHRKKRDEQWLANIAKRKREAATQEIAQKRPKLEETRPEKEAPAQPIRHEPSTVTVPKKGILKRK